ncbi:hypothetical protein MMC18_007352 [Xylographa bjoerkii]|nr:hypothetical protein [Xylographa bjoerkii]
MKKLTRTDGFVTVDSFVGIVIGMNIVVFTGVIAAIGELEIKVVTAVLDGTVLPPGVLDNVVGGLRMVDRPDIVIVEGMSFEGTTELLDVVLDITMVTPTSVLAIELVKRVVMSFDGSAVPLVGIIDVFVETLLIVAAKLAVEADVTDTVLEDAANVTTAAVVRVAAATDGTLTVMPDRLAHS